MSYLKNSAIALFLSLMTGCSVAYLEEIGGVVGSRVLAGLPQVTVSLPLGINPNGNNVNIRNNSSFFAEVISFGKRRAILAPGETGLDVERWEPLVQFKPVVIRFFSDPGLTEYVGVTERIIVVDQNPAITSWPITNGDIRTPNGSWVAPRDVGVYPTQQTDLAVREINLGRAAFGGMNVLQVQNNTLHEMVVTIDGRDRRVVEPAGLLYAVLTGGIIYGSKPVQVVTQWLDGGRLVGDNEFIIEVGGNLQPRTHQFVLSPYDIRRY